MLSAVELARPNMMTMAIGAWISLPGSPAESAIGTSARPAASAVIRIGTSRSLAPRTTAVRKSVTPSCSCRCRMCETSMMPLRVAMPKSVMKPTIDATDSTPPARYTPMTPPISASGRFSMISAPSRDEPKAADKMKKIATMTPADSHSSCCDACASLSNWPPYSMW